MFVFPGVFPTKNQTHPEKRTDLPQARCNMQRGFSRSRINVITLGIFGIWVLNQKYGENPKMDGENKGKPFEQMDGLGVFPLFLETPQMLDLSGW